MTAPKAALLPFYGKLELQIHKPFENTWLIGTSTQKADTDRDIMNRPGSLGHGSDEVPSIHANSNSLSVSLTEVLKFGDLMGIVDIPKCAF